MVQNITPSLPARKRGAPLGNKNALKHGFYSHALTRQEQRDPRLSAHHGLQPEIDLLKVLIARTVRLLEPVSAETSLSYHQSLAMLSVVSLAISRLNSFYRSAEELGAAGDASLIEFCKRLGFSPEQIDQELYGPVDPAHRGRLGNTNALRHGFYASVFEPEEIRSLGKTTLNELTDEISLLRILIKRLVTAMRLVPGLPFFDVLKGVRVITYAASCVEKLDRTRRLVFSEPDTLHEILESAIDEFDAELKAAGLRGLNPRVMPGPPD